jgi:dCTP deaminase
VRKVTRESSPAVKRFQNARTSIQNCLGVGVVPHSTDSVALDPISIINSAFCFYLTSLPTVITRFEGPSAQNNVAAHSRWTKRLEMWTMKAIEDSQMHERLRTLKGTAVWSSSKKEILKRMREYPVDHRSNLVITPLFYEEDTEIFDADAVDLRLGCHFLLPKTLDQPFFSPDQTSSTSLHVRVHVPLGHFLVVPAHQTILGATLEFIKLPSDLSGQVLTKSSVARTFIVVETAPWIHPQYRGCLTLEIANVSNTPVLLYPGRPICQLILMRIAPVEDRNTAAKTPHEKGNDTSAQIDKNYFGPVYPEAPKFKNPEDDLLNIGVTRVSGFKRIQLRRTVSGWQEIEPE